MGGGHLQETKDFKSGGLADNGAPNKIGELRWYLLRRLSSGRNAYSIVVPFG
jgi:hypothetical protein